MYSIIVKNPPANAGDAGDAVSVLVSGRSPGGGNDNPLQYSCLENSVDRRAWWATVHGVTNQFSSVTQSCPTLCDPMNRSTPGLPVHHQFLQYTQTHVHRVSDAIQPSHPLPSPSPPAPIPPSIRVFSNESTLRMRWPKYWSFSFNISPSNEHPGLISFRMDWLDLIAVQGTLKSLLQHHSSKASSVLSFLHSPTLTSIHDYWKNHSLD